MMKMSVNTIKERANDARNGAELNEIEVAKVCKLFPELKGKFVKVGFTHIYSGRVSVPVGVYKLNK